MTTAPATTTARNGLDRAHLGATQQSAKAPPVYPFTAIVGQERMKLALLLNAVHPALGGVLVFGEKGSAKSTAVRALTALLPEIEVVRGCLYNCDPTDPEPCEDCAARRAIGPLIDRVRRRVPLVELPVGATADAVLGRLDIEYTARTGLRRFEAGLLARAHRGILYADEVNLLGNNLVDILLDAAAMGQNYVEREGISIAHPASFALIGTMNPQEGELRPQLLDRFALVVEVQRLPDPAQRAEVVRRRMAYEADPELFLAAWAPAEEEMRRHVMEARERVAGVTVPDDIIDLITQVCAAYDVDGLRADLAIYRAAVARVAFEGRAEVTPPDVRAAAELALPHRRHREPAHLSALDQQRLDDVLRDAGL
jgi:magnesium chelatase subunit D